MAFANFAYSDELELQQAAVQAIKHIEEQPSGEIWEYGGIIVMHDGQYQYTTPKTTEHIDAVTIDVPYLLLPGDTLAGVYHSHPCYKGYLSGYYSYPDLFQAFFFKVPSFILDECTGDVHEFAPSVDDPHATGRVLSVESNTCKPINIHLPSGRIVGNIDHLSTPMSIPDQDERCPNK